ncbi:hypothetical protein ACHAXS_010752 [Conticribra weissflogii]
MHDNPLNDSAFFQYSTSSAFRQSQTSDARTANRTDQLKLLLYDLNSAIAPRSSRLHAIYAILDEFDHHDRTLHDQELDVRADQILLQKLTYALSVDETSDEVGYICHGLEMVYRGSKARVEVSFREVREAMLPILVDMVAPPKGRNISKEPMQRGDGQNGDPDGGRDGDANDGHVPEEDLLHVHHGDARADRTPYGEGVEETKHDYTATTPIVENDDDDVEEELASALAAAASMTAAQRSDDALTMDQGNGQGERQRRREQQQQQHHQRQNGAMFHVEKSQPQPFHPQIHRQRQQWNTRSRQQQQQQQQQQQ